MSDLAKQAIANAFLELVEEQDIRDITIREITERCGINRGTFYYHFDDVFDLMQWAFERRLNEFLKTVDTENINIEQIVRILREYISKERGRLVRAYDPRYHSQYNQFITRNIQPLIEQTIRSNPAAVSVPEEKICFMAESYTNLIVHIIVGWIIAGAPAHEEYSIEDIVKLVDEDIITRTLQKFSE